MPSAESPSAAVDLDTLIAAVREGAAERFQELIAACEPQVRSIAALVTGRADVADDVVQETFLTVYRQLDRYRLGSDAGAWIRSIARNCARSEGRRRARPGQRSWDDQVVESFPAAWAALVDRAGEDGQDAGAALGRCLDALAPAARAVVEAHYLGGQTLEAIAAQARRSGSWARMLLLRSRALLARCLRQAGVAHA